jgi:hypothetical protein
MSVASLPNFQAPITLSPDSAPERILLASNQQNMSCPAFLKTHDGKPLAYVSDVKLLQGTAYLFVAGNTAELKPDEYREVFLVAGESQVSMGRFRGRDISEMQSWMGSRRVFNAANPGGPYEGNIFNGAGGLHNAILKNADAADFAMVQAYQRTLPQIKINVSVNSAMPGENEAVLNAARTLGLEPQSDGRTYYLPDTEFGGRVALAMKEAMLENARRRGQSPIDIPIAESIKGASPAFYKGVENGINDIRIGGLVKLIDASLGLLALGKAAGFKYRSNWRAARGFPKAAPVQMVPGGGVLDRINAPITQARIRNEQRQVRETARTSVPGNNAGGNTGAARDATRSSNPSNRAAGNNRAGSDRGVRPSQVGNGSINPGGQTSTVQPARRAPTTPGTTVAAPQTFTPTQQLAQQRLGMIEAINQDVLAQQLGNSTLKLLGDANRALQENQTTLVGGKPVGYRDFVKGGGWWNVSDKLAIVGIGDRIYVLTPQNGSKQWTGSSVSLLPGGRSLDLQPDLVPRSNTSGNSVPQTGSTAVRNNGLPSGVQQEDQSGLRAVMSQAQRSNLWQMNGTFKQGGINAGHWQKLLGPEQTPINLGMGLGLVANPSDKSQIWVVASRGGKNYATSVSILGNGQGLNLPPLVSASDVKGASASAGLARGVQEKDQAGLRAVMSEAQRATLWEMNGTFKPGGINAALWGKLLGPQRNPINLGDGLRLVANPNDTSQVWVLARSGGKTYATSVSILGNGQGLNLPPLVNASDVRGASANAGLPSGALEKDQPGLRAVMSDVQRSTLWEMNGTFKPGGINAALWKDLLGPQQTSIDLGQGVSLVANPSDKSQVWVIAKNGGKTYATSVSILGNGQGLNLPPLVSAADVNGASTSSAVNGQVTGSSTTLSGPLNREQAQKFVSAKLIRGASTSGSQSDLEAGLTKVANWVAERASQNPNNLKSEEALLKYLKSLIASPVYSVVLGRAMSNQELPPVNITRDQANAILFPDNSKPSAPSTSAPASTPNTSPLTNSEIRDAIAKEFSKIGFKFSQQRIDDYRNGRKSPEQALAGLTGDARALVFDAINAIDQNKIPGAAINGGTSSVQVNAEEAAALVNSWAGRFNGYLGLDLALTKQIKTSIESKISELTAQGIKSDNPRITSLKTALDNLNTWEKSIAEQNAGTDRIVEFINKRAGQVPSSLRSQVAQILNDAISSGSLNTQQLQDYKAALDAVSVVSVQRVSNRIIEDLKALAGASLTVTNREIAPFTNTRTQRVTPGYTTQVFDIKGPISRELAAYLANGNIVGNRRTYSREDLDRLIETFQSASQIVLVGKLNNDAIQGREDGAPVTGDRRWEFGVASIKFDEGLNGADNRSDYLGNVYQDANGQGALVTEEAVKSAFSRGKDLVGYTTGIAAMGLYNNLDAEVTRVEVRGNSKAAVDALAALNWLPTEEALGLKTGSQDRRDRRIVEILTERIVGAGKKDQVRALLRQIAALDGVIRFDFSFKRPSSSSGPNGSNETVPPSQPTGSGTSPPTSGALVTAESSEISQVAQQSRLGGQVTSNEPLQSAPKRELSSALNSQVAGLAAGQLGLSPDSLTASVEGSKVYQVQQGDRFGLLAVKEDQNSGLFPKEADYISLASGSDFGILESLVLQAREDSTKRRKDLAGVTTELSALLRMNGLGARNVGVAVRDPATFNELIQWGRGNDIAALLRQNGLGNLASDLANPRTNQKSLERTLGGLSTNQLTALSNVLASTNTSGAMQSALIYKFQFDHLANQSQVSAWQVARAMGRIEAIPENDPRWKRIGNWWQRLRTENPVLSLPSNTGASFDLLVKRVAFSATQTPQFQQLESTMRAQSDRLANVVDRNPVLAGIADVSQKGLTAAYDVTKTTLGVAGKVVLPVAGAATVATLGLLGEAARSGKLKATVGRVGTPPSPIELQAAKLANLQPGENFLWLETDAPGIAGGKAQMVISTGMAVIQRPALAPGQTGSLPWYSINEEGMRLLLTATANAGRVNIATRYGTNNLAAGQTFELTFGRTGANPVRAVQPREGRPQLNSMFAADIVSWGATSNIYVGEYVLRDPRIRTIGGKPSVANSVISLNSAYDKNESYFGPLQFPKELPAAR